MPIYYNSRQISGYSSHTNDAWSNFMNSYAAHPYDTSANANELPDVSGNGSFTAPYSGTYTMKGAADNYGTINLGGQSTSCGGFSSNGNSVSRYYSQGSTVGFSWTFGNTPGGSNFEGNPSAIAFTVEGPAAPDKPSVSLDRTPSTIIQGESVYLEWSSSGGETFSLTDVSNPGSSGDTTKTPNNTKTYVYTACNEGGCSEASRTVTVYIPPTISIFSNVNNIIAGGQVTISWDGTSGDGSTITWVSGGIDNNNLQSSETVNPDDTTNYCAYVSGLGGTSPTVCKEITVYQIPTINNFSVPESLNYGENSVIELEYSYADVSAVLSTSYTYRTITGGFETVSGPTQILTQSGSPELNGQNTTITYSVAGDNALPTNITYNSNGPFSVEYLLTVSGSGGSDSVNATTTINVDTEPVNMDVQETDDLIRGTEPVYGPDIAPGDVILSDLYFIEDIDIPVEIKSNLPIQVRLNNTGDWNNIRQQ